MQDHRTDGVVAVLDDVVVVDVMDSVHIRCGSAEVSGNALGGRRGRVALVALAVASGPVPAEVLAQQIWGDEPPVTWPVALRGIIRSLRAAAADSAIDSWLIESTPAGYRLRPGVVVSIAEAADRLEIAERLLSEERYSAARTESEPLISLGGSSLLPGEDLPWLESHRRMADNLRVRAHCISAAASHGLGDFTRAVASARQAVATAPLDEQTHRLLVAMLTAAGDRAGVVEAYEACRALLAEQLGVHPSPQTEDAYLSALRDPGSTGQPARLPTETTSFHGRDADLEELRKSLSAAGVVCVIGGGGVGKSRLVQRAALRSTHFDGGRHWVHLSNLGDDDLVASDVAIALGSLVGTADPAEAAARFLAPLGRTLLVLDGCEGVSDGVRSLLGLMRERCPLLTVVVTSRVPLSIPGEELHVLRPLSMGGSVKDPAVELLVERVKSAGGRLIIDETTAPLIHELCHRCGGLPLALELAAAQLARMAIGDLLDQLADTGQDQLRGILSQSCALLDEQEAAVFRRLAVLQGPSGLTLIRNVVSDQAVPAVRVVRLLGELVKHGLLSVDTSGPRWLYQQDDDIHAYAWELLVEFQEETAAFTRLAGTIRGILPADAQVSPAVYSREIGAVAPALRSLLGACVAGRFDVTTGLEISFRLHRYWAATDVAEGRFWLTRLLEGNENAPGAGLAMFALGYLGCWSGNAEEAIPYLAEAISRPEEVGDVYRVRALMFLGYVTDDLDRTDEALAFLREAETAARNLSPALRKSTTIAFACILSSRGDPAATEYAERAVALCRLTNEAAELGSTLSTAAGVCWEVGDLDAARDYVAQARPLLEAGEGIPRVQLFTVAAAIAIAEGDVAAAIDHGRAAEDGAVELGVDRSLPLIRCLLARALLASGDITAAADCAAASIQACRSLTYWHELSACLEATAMVLLAMDGKVAAGQLLNHAAALRALGNRPTPPLLPAPPNPDPKPGVAPAQLDHEFICDFALSQLEPLGRPAVVDLMEDLQSAAAGDRHSQRATPRTVAANSPGERKSGGGDS